MDLKEWCKSCNFRENACLYKAGIIKLKPGEMCPYDRDYSYGDDGEDRVYIQDKMIFE